MDPDPVGTEHTEVHSGIRPAAATVALCRAGSKSRVLPRLVGTVEWTAELDPTFHFVHVVTRGTFTVPDHLRMIEDILSRPFWQPGTPALFDHRQLDMDAATYETMAAASQNHLRNDRRIGDGKAAILVGSLAAFGSARQFEMLVGGQVEARLQVFLDPKAALAWLLP